MDLTINSRIIIPSSELQWRFSRSSGSGGQNVNKTDSRVEIIFDIQGSKVLSQSQKFLIKEKLKSRIINSHITIAVQDKRTQYQNRQLALERLSTLIREGIKPRTKSRIQTKPTNASRKRRVDSKKRRGQIKKARQQKLISEDV